MKLDITAISTRLKPIRKRDPRLLSYNIEMAELTGGMFWKPYTDAQISGAEDFPELSPSADLMDMVAEMMTVQPPVNLSSVRLRTLAGALGPAIVRHSGSWATKTYFDIDGTTAGTAPAGFDAVLTREQWDHVLDFAKAVGAELLISVANCPGVHENGTGVWQPAQAEALWSYTESKGMKISYAEFMNEPNILVGAGMPQGYGAKELARDHDLFAAWLSAHHPETKLVGPCNSLNPRMGGSSAAMMVPAEALLEEMTVKPEIFSYHSYTGISERGKLFGHHYEFSQALSEDYLGVTMEDLAYNEQLRDKCAPGADMWVTESADAGSGGNTWAPTFVETIRFVDELARFAARTKGIIFHNTLCSSAYGLLEAETFKPRPQYWGGLLYNRLMGLTVYDTGEPLREGVHLYAQSRADGRDGVCYLFINNSQTAPAALEVPESEIYMLTAPFPRSRDIYLNGEKITLPDDESAMPQLMPQKQSAGELVIPPCSLCFIVTE